MWLPCMFLMWGQNITFLSYSAWQLLHFTNGFNSLSYPQALRAVICELFMLTFAWTKPYTPKPIKAVTSKGQGKPVGHGLGIVMTFQTQKLFLIWNILIKCVFGPVSSFAVSTANNLLAQLWLLPKLSTLLPSTHTDTHYHLLSHSWTQAATQPSVWRGLQGAPAAGFLSQQQCHFSAAQGMSLMSLPSTSFHYTQSCDSFFSAAGPTT